jgi:hypothetical protein
MNIDQLKMAWQQEASAPLETASVLQIIQQPSASPVHQMKKNLYEEWVMGLLLVGVLSIVLLTLYNGAYREGAYICIGLGVIYTSYYIFKLQVLKKMAFVNDEIRTSLRKQLHLLERATQLYLWSSTVITPFLFYYLGWLVLTKEGLRKHLNIQIAFSDIQLPFIFLVLLVSAGLFFLYKTYIIKLYGRHIDALKALLKETEQ